MPDVPDLAPCPFCSSPPRLVPADLTAATWVVTCLDCDIEGPWHDSRAATVDAWNTRPEVKRLREQLTVFATIIAQPDASLPPDLPDDAVDYVELTVGEVRSARAWLAGGT